MNFALINKPTFLSSLGLLLSVTIPLIICPGTAAIWGNHTRTFVLDNFGVTYIALGAGSFIFMIHIAFNKNGRYDIGQQANVEGSVIDVTEMPEHDPWHPKGSWNG